MGQNAQKNRAEAVIARCRLLAEFSEEVGTTRRTFLSPPMRDVHREIELWMKPLGMHVRVDAAGNLRGLYPGQQSGAPRLVLGSHLDTVPNAGAFDGILGVVLAIALVEALEGNRFCFSIEVIGFSDEEGVRFGAPFIGSRALVGSLDDELLNRQGAEGISVRKAIEDFGLKPEEIPNACLDAETLGYIEFHIEQGPMLEKLGDPLGIVEAIAGQSRVEMTFLGRANHAGTTPLHFRRDAMTGAAEWICAVENHAGQIPGAVATVGKIQVKPGVVNVIPGEVQLSLDVRHRSDEIRHAIVAELTRKAERICERRALSVQHRVLLDQRAVALDPFLIGEIELAMRKIPCVPRHLISGAGHDAMILAEKTPSAMIFLRTPGGISHDPQESVMVEDVEKALECGLHLLQQLAASPALQNRTCRA